MPRPTSERQALERERDELPAQIAAHQVDLATTPATNKARRERLEWQVRNLQKRLETITARLAVTPGLASASRRVRTAHRQEILGDRFGWGGGRK